jgi:membrane protein DedA with SNARE-associated domain
MEQTIYEIMQSVAHSPWLTFSLLFVIMYASSFGLPLPEEVTLLTLGFLVYLGNQPDPITGQGGAGALNIHLSAWLAFIAVFSSDFLVYFLGRKYGDRILNLPVLKKFAGPAMMLKVEHWMAKWGFWAAGVFRFTPGIRFAGHLSCGILKVPLHKFCLVDGLAALISVPTQIYLVGYYGRDIIDIIKKYQPWVILALVIGVILYYRREIYRLIFMKNKSNQEQQDAES